MGEHEQLQKMGVYVGNTKSGDPVHCVNDALDYIEDRVALATNALGGLRKAIRDDGSKDPVGPVGPGGLSPAGLLDRVGRLRMAIDCHCDAIVQVCELLG